MLRRIMVPLDGSRFGEWALPRAVALARHAGAEIELVSVHVPFTLSATPDGSGFEFVSDEAAQQARQAYVERTAGGITAATGVSVTPTVRCGMVQATLLDHAAATLPDLIVMTTHGRGALQRMWLGSVADGMVRHAMEPILLERPETDAVADPAAGELFHHILVPLDGSAQAEQILPIALDIAGLARAQCTVVRVVEPPFVPPPYGMLPPAPADDRLLAELRARAEDYVATVADRLELPESRLSTRVLVDTLIAPALLAEATREDVDLIALSTHGRGPVGRLLLGSVADKVVRGAHTAVLLYRPRDE